MFASLGIWPSFQSPSIVFEDRALRLEIYTEQIPASRASLIHTHTLETYPIPQNYHSKGTTARNLANSASEKGQLNTPAVFLGVFEGALHLLIQDFHE